MADTVIGARLEADDQISPKVKSIKAELKLAQLEVIKLTEKFGATSIEAANAAKHAAELKDKIHDGAKLVEAFNPETKFRAFGASINTVVGGFTALTGVMGLVGVKSKEVEQLLLKVQSALALSQGIAQLQEGIKSFRNLSSVIQQTTLFQKANSVATAAAAAVQKLFAGAVDTTSISFRVLKGAIIATGIGLLIVVIGELVAAFDRLANSAKVAAEEQKKAFEETIKFLDEALGKNLDRLQQDRDLSLARAKLAGASEQELLKIQETFSRRKIAALKRTDEDSNSLGELHNRLQKEIKTEEVKIEVDALNLKNKIREKNIEDAKAAKAKELEQARKDAALRAEMAAGRITGKVTPGLGAEIVKTPEQLQFEAEVKARHDLREQEAADIERFKAFKEANTQFEIDQAEQRMAINQAEYDAKLAIANAGIDILNTLSDLVGRQTVAGKILAIASIATNTAIGFMQGLVIAQKSAQAAGPGAAFAFPIFYATQIAAVLAAVSKAKAALGAGGGSVSFSAPHLAPAATANAPLAPQRAENQTTTLDQTSLNAIGNATTRAFVLEADVTNNQERIRRLNRAARL